ncbi:chromosome condensation protein CcrB [Alicyclobacillus cellulosilyticus]|uniref:Fluoride-specific ion channel FluC n=1 Tax=Alicyclobacillus cellulosilyticus TaxID=1003997 RepID=A0A917KCW6_9BACL|nr:fluoride efflux transporter CrcB [Alicyclobacillus cellulosilyticus]GGJ06379.1 chromosome condensation protein CcrB [Alicyclobacillus cellulosilyticus]
MAYLAVALGGFTGAVLRYLLSEWMATWHGFPAATLLINTSGSLFLTWFYTYTMERFPIHPHLRLGIGTGLVGAFTTYSTYAVETWKLVDARALGMALAYATASMGLSLAAAGVGYRLAMRQSRLRWAGEGEGEAP